MPRILAPMAKPIAREMPWPREPVVISTPGVFSRSQWLGRDVPPWFSVSSRSSGKKPLRARVA